MSDIISIRNVNVGSQIRNEELDGRRYIVVPMVMLVEGVHTGSQGPVYYSVAELAKSPQMWNMKPIVLEHPFRGDTATDLEVYKKQAVGFVMGTHFINGKLKAEAWIDKEKAQNKCPSILEHINHRLPMEISTGLFSELVEDYGVWRGEPYRGKIINIRADHLAILPKIQGACSLSDGAGLLINERRIATDTLNIVTTTNNYVAGSMAVESLDGLDEEKPKQPEKQEQTVPYPPLEVPKAQSYTLPDGTEITIKPPTRSLELPDPDRDKNALRYHDSIPAPSGVRTIVQDEMSTTDDLLDVLKESCYNPPEEPIADNPSVIPPMIYEKDDGKPVAITSDEVDVILLNIRNVAQQLRTAILNSAAGGEYFTVNKNGSWFFNSVIGSQDIEQTAQYNALRNAVADITQQIQKVKANQDISDHDATLLPRLDQQLTKAQQAVLDFHRNFDLLQNAGKPKGASDSKSTKGKQDEGKALRMKVAELMRQVFAIREKQAEQGKISQEEAAKLKELDKQLADAKLDVLDFQKSAGRTRKEGQHEASQKDFERFVNKIDATDPVVKEVAKASGEWQELEEEWDVIGKRIWGEWDGAFEKSNLITPGEYQKESEGKSEEEKASLYKKLLSKYNSERQTAQRKILAPVVAKVQQQESGNYAEMGRAFVAVRKLLQEIPKINANDPAQAPLWFKYMQGIVDITDDFPEILDIAPELRTIRKEYADAQEHTQEASDTQAEIEETLPHLKDRARSVGSWESAPDFDPRQTMR